MRIAALITVYNGLELLPKCIENLQNQVDGIIICYQNVSNKGNFSPHVGTFCRSTWAHCIKFTPDLTLKTKQNELNKHDFMVQYAKKQGFTHAVLMATDHFYEKSQFDFARKDIEHQGYDLTLTSMFTYYKKPTWRIEPIEDYYMPFIFALRQNTKVERVAGFPLLVDPSVQINTFANYRLYKPSEVILHHYSMLRNDIREKFANAAASIRWKPYQVERFANEFDNAELGQSLEYFKGRKLVECEDFFGLSR